MSEQQSLPPENFAPVQGENRSGSPSTPPNPPQSNDDGGAGSLLAIGLSIIALGIAGYLWYFQPNQPSNNIAVVDTQVLVSAMVSREMASGNATPDSMSAKLTALNAHLDGIAANGTVLLQKSAVVSPQGLPDLTEEIATAMNIDIHNIQLPAVQPPARQPESPVKAPDSDTAVMTNNGLDASLD
ncbi:MAG: hypothetical protein J5680_06775 [Neisseriaceae bacterium]|nr:hypothetical protein [Neisseriaceae bacterium]MBR5676249.1 hypothetical protein [Neisseriaceae bacterium]